MRFSQTILLFFAVSFALVHIVTGFIGLLSIAVLYKSDIQVSVSKVNPSVFHIKSANGLDVSTPSSLVELQRLVCKPSRDYGLATLIVSAVSLPVGSAMNIACSVMELGVLYTLQLAFGIITLVIAVVPCCWLLLLPAYILNLLVAVSVYFNSINPPM